MTRAISSSPAQLQLILPSMARLDLTDEERDQLVRALRGIVDNDRFSRDPTQNHKRALDYVIETHGR